MEIKNIVVSTMFTLKVTRQELDALEICLNQAYHYSHNRIPKHLQSVTSQLMDTVDDAIRKDDDLQLKMRT